LVVALVGGCFGVVGAGASAVLGRGQAGLEARLSTVTSERAAALDYEYKARMRLYERYEPLRFQLVEAASLALRCISAISRNDGPSADRDPEASERALAIAAYELLCPLAIGRLFERNLTLVDLQLDRRIAAEYGLVTFLLQSFADLDILAAYKPDVTPRNDPGEQYISVVELGAALDLLLTNDGSSRGRVRGFPEFEALFLSSAKEGTGAPLGAVRRILSGLGPNSKPALWRVFVIHVLLYGCFLRLALLSSADNLPELDRLGAEIDVLLRSALKRGARLDLPWDIDCAAPPSGVVAAAFEAALPAATEYFRRRVSAAVWVPPVSQVTRNRQNGLGARSGQ
jgi:hypothetical protein